MSHNSHEILRAWKAALGTTDPEVLDRRLSWDHLTQEAALAALQALPSENRSGISFACISAWLRSSHQIGPSDAEVSASNISFVELWESIALAALRELEAVLPLPIAGFYETGSRDWGIYADVRRALLNDLTRQLSLAGEAPLWEAFNKRRTIADLIFAQLSAASAEGEAPPRAIYYAFLEELRISGLETLALQYPVLQTHFSLLVENWLQNSKDLLTRVHDDLKLLRHTFHLPEDAVLSSVRPNFSDPHRGGQRVAILGFRSPSGLPAHLQVVYKPKQMGLDRAFQDLIERCNLGRPAAERLQSVAVLPQAGYGYMEYVPHRPCQSGNELRSFYKRAGRLTALLYLLGCVDCHFENLIACGDQFLLIDAETLLEGVAIEHRDFQNSPSHSSLQPRIDNSVLRLGLLPQWIFAGERRTPVDVSALGAQPPSDEVQQVEGWQFLNTDAMVAGKIAQRQELPTSSPVGFGSRNRLAEFAEAYCKSFEHELLSALANKSQWMEDGGFLAAFQGCTRRFVSRPTWIYQWLRSEQFEIKHLRSSVGQRILLENLARSYLLSRTKPASWPMFAAEAAQMERLDIPFFEQPVSSLELGVSDGEVIPGFLQVSGYDHARNRIESLDRDVIDFEMRLIRGVITARDRSAPDSSAERAVLLPSRNAAVFSAEERLAEAEGIADGLLASALYLPDGSVEWMAIKTEEDERRSGYGPIGPTLYSGQAGVALFLAAIARRGTAKSREYCALAESAVARIIQFTTLASPDALGRWWRDQPLGLAGSGGVLLALVTMGQLNSRYRTPESTGIPRLLEAFDPELLRSDRRVDIMLGCAGLIGALLAVDSDRARSLAEQAGDNLLQAQDPDGGWIIASVGPTALTGFSHGASGIVAALARLHTATDLNRFAAAAVRGLQYERAAFSENTGNWPDFREPFDPASLRFGQSWCHGAPGIALARLCLARTPVLGVIDSAELEIALQTTSTATETGDSLCCGRTGCAAILRFASRTFRSKMWLDAASRLESLSLENRRRKGNYSFIDNVGLFTGLAGLALGLLDSTAPPTEELLPHLLSAGLAGYRHDSANSLSFDPNNHTEISSPSR